MEIRLDKIDYQNMTWKQVFETFQGNIDRLYQAILASYTSVEVEQFGGGVSTVAVSSIVDEDTEWLVFRNDHYLGKRDGGETYHVNGQIIEFFPPLEEDEEATVLITNGNGIAVLANHYISEIRDMYDSLSGLDINLTRHFEEITSIKDYLDESALGILDAKTICKSYKEYIENLLRGSLPPEGQVSAEILAARRGYDLLGGRLDTMVTSNLEKRVFMDSLRYHDGDWVFVKDADDVTLYLVKDEYEGSLPHERMTYGQTAVCVMKNKNTEVLERLVDLESRVSRLESIYSN